MEIPEGYVLVPKIWAEKYFARAEWDEVINPTISQTSLYLGVSAAKIKKDLRKVDCPLRKSFNGGKGKGNEMRFFKASVAHYKEWIEKF